MPAPSDIAKNFNYAQYTNPELTGSAAPSIGQSVVNGITRALPSGFTHDVQTLSDFRLGTFLRDKNLLNGDQASILNGVIDLFRSDASNSIPRANFSIDYTKNFIPIIIKTQFNINRTLSATNPRPLYIVFDSTPESISFSKQASWNPVPIYGRPEPIQIFNSSGQINFKLTGTFFSVHPQDHPEKLKLSDRLFALVTPSKYHMMPSPVEVTIGEWKRLRCIVTNVSIEYKGPWWINSENTGVTVEARNTSNQSTNATTGSPRNVYMNSYSPYIYEATFDFTVVSELNSIQYAEDMVATGWNGGFKSNTDLGLLNNEMSATDTSFNDFTVSQLGGYILSNNTKITVDDTNWSNINYLNSLGLPLDSGGGSKLAAMAQITTGLTAEITGIINNKYGAKISKLLGK